MACLWVWDNDTSCAGKLKIQKIKKKDDEVGNNEYVWISEIISLFKRK